MVALLMTAVPAVIPVEAEGVIFTFSNFPVSTGLAGV